MRLLAPLRPIVTDPMLALAAVLLVLYGAHAATMLPYVSALAVTVFHLGDGAYSALLVAASVLSVGSSVGFGILADQRANRRGIALVTGAFLALGTLAVWLVPATPVFVVAHALFLPLSGSIFGQLFALGRLASTLHPEEDRPAILATLRAAFALPWVIVLPIWSLAFGAGAPLLQVYPVAMAMAAGFFGLTWVFWPRDGATRWPDPKSGLSFAAALREMAAPAVLIRVAALGTINGAITLYLVLLGLVFAAVPGRGAGDVALYAGLVAGLEVPLMLALPLIIGRVSRNGLIFWGTALYCVHVAGLPLLASGPAVWLLVVFGAAGGAVVLTQPMAYLQDMLAARPGAGASLMALQKLAGDAICAATFALGTLLGGYTLAALIGAALAMIGAGALWALDRRAPDRPA